MRKSMSWAMGKVSGRMARISAALIMLTGLAWMGSATALASNRAALAPAAAARAGQAPGARVTGDPRVEKLISEMTLDEKLTLLEGAQEAASTNQFTAGYLPGIPGLASPRCGWPTARQVWRPATRRPG